MFVEKVVLAALVDDPYEVVLGALETLHIHMKENPPPARDRPARQVGVSSVSREMPYCSSFL